MPVLTDTRCKSKFGTNLVTATQVCAGETGAGKDTCQGDSGGPLVVKQSNGFWYLIGLTSWVSVTEHCQRLNKWWNDTVGLWLWWWWCVHTNISIPKLGWRIHRQTEWSHQRLNGCYHDSRILWDIYSIKKYLHICFYHCLNFIVWYPQRWNEWNRFRCFVRVLWWMKGIHCCRSCSSS